MWRSQSHPAHLLLQRPVYVRGKGFKNFSCTVLVLGLHTLIMGMIAMVFCSFYVFVELFFFQNVILVQLKLGAQVWIYNRHQLGPCLNTSINVYKWRKFYITMDWEAANQEQSPWSKSVTFKLEWNLQLPEWTSQMCFREKFLSSDETKIELFGHNDKRYICRS